MHAGNLATRDGIWTMNGLSADFRLISEHPATKGVYLVETAAGENYAYEEELAWDSTEDG